MSREESAAAKPLAPAQPRLAWLFYSVAVLLVALGILGVFNPSGHVVISTLFDHPWAFGVLVLAALAVACWVGLGPVAVRATGLTLGAIAAFGCAGSGALNWMAGSPSHQIVRVRAPAGQLEVRVFERAVVVDTVWELRVRQPAGLLSKEWSAGCLNGDNPDDGFESVKWVDATRLEVLVADGRVLQVNLDPATGRPKQPVTTGGGC